MLKVAREQHIIYRETMIRVTEILLSETMQVKRKGSEQQFWITERKELSGF